MYLKREWVFEKEKFLFTYKYTEFRLFKFQSADILSKNFFAEQYALNSDEIQSLLYAPFVTHDEINLHMSKVIHKMRQYGNRAGCAMYIVTSGKVFIYSFKSKINHFSLLTFFFHDFLFTISAGEMVSLVDVFFLRVNKNQFRWKKRLIFVYLFPLKLPLSNNSQFTLIFDRFEPNLKESRILMEKSPQKKSRLN